MLNLLFATLALAASSTGLKDADTFFFGFTETWTANFSEPPTSAPVEICVESNTVPGSLRKMEKARGALRALNESPCESMHLPDQKQVSVKLFDPSEVHDAFFNDSIRAAAPKQRSFDARVTGKAINEAYAALLAQGDRKDAHYYVMVVLDQVHAAMMPLPLPSSGGDAPIDPSIFYLETSGAFAFLNFYAHH